MLLMKILKAARRSPEYVIDKITEEKVSCLNYTVKHFIQYQYVMRW